MFSALIHSDAISSLRLDAEYYSPEYLAVEKKIRDFSSGYSPLRDIVVDLKDGPGGWGVSTNDYVEYGVPVIRGTNIKEMNVDLESCIYISIEKHNDLIAHEVKLGDVLISVRGTVGRSAVYQSDKFPVASINAAVVRMRAREDKIKPYYLVAFFESKYGKLQTERISNGAVQNNMNLTETGSNLIPIPQHPAQKYIGDKVRQVERLRGWAKALGAKVELLVSNEAMNTACATPEKKYNRPQLDDLSHRLDPKYYSNRAVAVFRRAKAIGKPLASLITGIANGFEERVFFDTGRDYITVTEVSSGRLELSSAPKISHATEVPDKAIIHERCVLVVRTGSIGTAVKVDARDRGAVISSHLIRLEFADEADAAAVAAYLCSTAGKVLQHKISYGAVQPQIGQDELLALPVPQFVLDVKEQILALITEKESAIRASKALTAMAKFLVEAVIEGQLTEADLIAAEQALQTGNDQPDRQILNRLKTDGIDGQGQALFSDLDQLYSLLQQADHS